MSREPRVAFAGPSGDLGAHVGGDVATDPQRIRLSHRRVIAIGIAMAALLVGVIAWQLRPATNPAIAGSTPITIEQLEEQYGIKLGVVGLLASGGLVEMQFQVVDADKARLLFGDVEDMPVLAVEGTSTVLESAKGMKHQLTLLDGASYFFLYTNVANALHEGSQVSFVINNQRVPHIEVRR